MVVRFPRRSVICAALAAPAAVMLALAPTSAAAPLPPGLGIHIPPLISLSVPSGPLVVPGITVNLPGIISVALPLKLDSPGIPVLAVKLNLGILDLPPTIKLQAPKLISLGGFGPDLDKLAPGLELLSGSTEVNAGLDKDAYEPAGDSYQIDIYGDVDD